VTAAGGLAYDRYTAGGFDEHVMRIGAADAPPVLFVPPLFEEMNRTRALIAATMRGLAAQGFGCWLPDLPGTGESLRPLHDVTWDEWREAVREAGDHAAAAGGRAPVVAALRGGALLDDAAEGLCHWRLAPATGASLARDLERTGLAGGADWAGYDASPALRAALQAATPETVAGLRTLRLASDRAEADGRIDGPALWRRSEPGTSAEMAQAAAVDIASWAKTCAGS
jgi:pimeloyl-ACP methyl ester carboxylesterase